MCKARRNLITRKTVVPRYRLPIKFCSSRLTARASASELENELDIVVFMFIFTAYFCIMIL